MTQLLVYLLLFGGVLYFLSVFGKPQRTGAGSSGDKSGKPNRRFRAKRSPNEVWMQVYETETMQEAKMLQARIQEEELECIVYEQGKKDIHGNQLKGVGVAVPKTSASQAQTIISRMPV